MEPGPERLWAVPGFRGSPTGAFLGTSTSWESSRHLAVTRACEWVHRSLDSTPWRAGSPLSLQVWAPLFSPSSRNFGCASAGCFLMQSPGSVASAWTVGTKHRTKTLWAASLSLFFRKPLVSCLGFLNQGCEESPALVGAAKQHCA